MISAATKTNAEILGRFDELGTLEPGKLADLVIVRGNPLANIGNIGNLDIVVKDGVLFYAETAAAGPVTEIGNAF